MRPVIIRTLRVLSGLGVFLVVIFIMYSAMAGIYIWYDMLDKTKLRIAHMEGQVEQLEKLQLRLGSAVDMSLNDEEIDEARKIAWEIDILNDDIYDEVVFRSIARRKLLQRIAELGIATLISVGAGYKATRLVFF